MQANVGDGLLLGLQTAYRENVIRSNTTGAVNGGVNPVDNDCAGPGVISVSCP